MVYNAIVDQDSAITEHQPQPVLKTLFKGKIKHCRYPSENWRPALRKMPGRSVKAALALTVSV
jgi:hypothetical protein